MTRNGTLFELIGLCFLILAAILLMNKEIVIVKVAAVLFLIGASFFWGGFIISRLSLNKEEGK